MVELAGWLRAFETELLPQGGPGLLKDIQGETLVPMISETGGRPGSTLRNVGVISQLFEHAPHPPAYVPQRS